MAKNVKKKKTVIKIDLDKAVKIIMAEMGHGFGWPETDQEEAERAADIRMALYTAEEPRR